LLHAQGVISFSLCIYTTQDHWEKHRRQLEGAGVQWGGWLPYAKVREKFSDAWLLLCTSSFNAAQKAFTLSSVQTKLTDYIAASCPVWVVAPEGAASGQWVETHHCGYWFQSNNPNEIAAYLLSIVSDNQGWKSRAENATALAKGNFSMEVIQKKLYQYLKVHAH
jgi:glycosyltransferase involved in cell wall biosynthesis